MSAHIIPRRGSLVAAISGTHITYFAGGRISVFRLYRRALLLKMSQAWNDHPVRMTKVMVSRNPLLSEPVYYLTIEGEEIVR